MRYRTPAVDIGVFSPVGTLQKRQHPIPISEPPDGSDLWSFQNILERTGILTLGMSRPWQDLSVKICGLTEKIAPSKRIILNLTPITLVLAQGWSRERTLPFYWMIVWTVYLPR